MLQVPDIAKRKWADFLNFQIFTPTVGLQLLLETEMWNTKDISKQFLKKIWIIFKYFAGGQGLQEGLSKQNN